VNRKTGAKGRFAGDIAGGQMGNHRAHDDPVDFVGFDLSSVQKCFQDQSAQVVRYQVFISRTGTLEGNPTSVDQDNLTAIIPMWFHESFLLPPRLFSLKRRNIYTATLMIDDCRLMIVDWNIQIL